MDGVPGITQSGIKDGEEMLYDFNCDERGSYWYHSHFKVSYSCGHVIWCLVSLVRSLLCYSHYFMCFDVF